MCNKIKFSLKEAKTALNEIKCHKKQYRHEKRYYYCDKCNCYHLTSDETHEEIIDIPIEELKFKENWKELM